MSMSPGAREGCFGLGRVSLVSLLVLSGMAGGCGWGTPKTSTSCDQFPPICLELSLAASFPKTSSDSHHLAGLPRSSASQATGRRVWRQLRGLEKGQSPVCPIKRQDQAAPDPPSCPTDGKASDPLFSGTLDAGRKQCGAQR